MRCTLYCCYIHLKSYDWTHSSEHWKAPALEPIHRRVFPPRKEQKDSNVSSSSHNGSIYCRGSDIWGWGLLCCKSQRDVLWSRCVGCVRPSGTRRTVNSIRLFPARPAAFPWKCAGVVSVACSVPNGFLSHERSSMDMAAACFSWDTSHVLTGNLFWEQSSGVCTNSFFSSSSPKRIRYTTHWLFLVFLLFGYDLSADSSVVTYCVGHL